MALDLLDALDPEQREVAITVNEPVCVVAGAGTGKTRAITHRIAYAVASGVADSTRTLAVTFTSKAAGELRERLASLEVPDVSARTFHSAALRQLRYFWPRIEQSEPPRLMPSKAGLAADLLSEFGWGKERLLDLIGEIEWAKVSLLSPEDYLDQAERRVLPSDFNAEQVADFYRAYEMSKAANASIDFEDVLLLTAGLIAENSAVAEQVRDQYRHFTVDEYQDISPLQQQLLELWVDDRRDICVVGDPQQTIYSFAGADANYLRRFAERYDAKVLRLFRDYRSTPQIVEFANRLIPSEHGLVGQQDHGPTPEVVAVDGDELPWLVERVTGLIRSGVLASDIAVLVRTNAQVDALARMMKSRGLNAAVRHSEGDDFDGEGVAVASLHAAKGLEWEHVLIGGVSEGLLPISYAVTPEAIDEERRLFYVGITRARRNLTISFAGKRSRFLDAPTSEVVVPERRASAAAVCRVCGTRLVDPVEIKRTRCSNCPAVINEVLLARLQHWRSEIANQRGIPEFLIATDATLAALAEVEPRSAAEVRQVAGPRLADEDGQALARLISG